MSDMTPHDLDAEKAVLGAVLIDNDHLEIARALISPEQFFRAAHQQLFTAMCRVSDAGQPVDFVTLRAALGDFEAVGGAVYVSDLVNGVPRATNVAAYARTVHNLASKRRVIKAARKMEARAHDIDATADALIDEAESELMGISASGGEAADLTAGQDLSCLTREWLDEQASRRHHGGITGVSSGIQTLDRMTEGFQPGDLVIIGARPSQGKTALGLQFAVAARKPVAFFSLEMGKAQLGARAVALLAEVNGWDMRRGVLGKPELDRVTKGLDTLASTGLGIDDTAAITPWALRSKARRFKVQHGLAMVVVDYIGLMTPPKVAKGANREQEVAAISKSLKALAKELQVPVVALSQLNRDSAKTGKAPTLADLRESGSLEQDADVVLFLHRADQATVKDEGPAELIVAKQRNGPTGVVDLWWIPQQTRFREQLEQQGVA